MRLASIGALVSGLLAQSAFAKPQDQPWVYIADLGSPNEASTDIRDVHTTSNPQTWLTPEDRYALAPQGTPEQRQDVIITVNANDTVIGCKVVADEKGLLTRRICPVVIKRGRFRHAISADGKKIGGLIRLVLSLQGLEPDGTLYRAPISPPSPSGWKPPKRAELLNLPDLHLASAGPLGMPVVVADIAVNGQVTRCKIFRTSGDDDVDTAACRLVLKKGQFRATTDDNGKPASGIAVVDFRA